MKIIAKIEGGFLIEATENEVQAVLTAVTGKQQTSPIQIGQKIPAIDYASTIEKIKALSKNSNYTNLLEYASRFQASLAALDQVVDSAASIEI